MKAKLQYHRPRSLKIYHFFPQRNERKRETECTKSESDGKHNKSEKNQQTQFYGFWPHRLNGCADRTIQLVRIVMLCNERAKERSQR